MSARLVQVLALLLMALGVADIALGQDGHGSQLLAEAEAAYQAADYPTASARFGEAIQQGVGDVGAVEYGWALSEWGAGDPLLALLHFHRARVGLGARASTVDLNAWISRCEDRLGLDAGASTPAPPAELRAWIRLGGGVLMQLVAILGLVRAGRRLALLSAPALLVGLILSLQGAAHLQIAPPAALLTRPGQRLCLEPHPSAATGAVLRLGVGVRILASSDRWAEVRVGESRGWLPTESLALLE